MKAARDVREIHANGVKISRSSGGRNSCSVVDPYRRLDAGREGMLPLAGSQMLKVQTSKLEESFQHHLVMRPGDAQKHFRYSGLRCYFGSTDYSCICTNNPSARSGGPCEVRGSQTLTPVCQSLGDEGKTAV